MSENSPPVNPDLSENRRSNLELLIIVLGQNMGKLILGGIASVFGYIILSDRGYVPTVEIELWMWLSATMIVPAYLLARYIYTKTGGNEPEYQRVAVVTHQNLITTLKIPKALFTKFSTEGHVPSAHNLEGDNLWVARKIDFGEFDIIPAGVAPEEQDVPDDVEVLVEEGSTRAIHQLEDYVTDLVDLRSEQTISDRVRYKRAKGEVTKTIAKRMQEVDNAESLDDVETEKKAEAAADEVIRKMAGLSEGDSNE